MGNFITPSLISTQSLCEWIIYLEKVKGQKRARTQQMLEGSKTHATLEDDFLKKAERMPIEHFVREGGVTREFFLISQKHGLWGRIDELVITPEHAIIIDDKKNAKPYPSHINQLVAYAFLIEEELLPAKPIFMALRDSASREIVWIERYNPEHRERLLNIIDRIRDIVAEYAVPNPTTNPKICSFCSLECPMRLAPYTGWSEEQKTRWEKEKSGAG